jgi:geranylgeranylglycerol-phosphate geranylgeranyltransferase
MSQSTIQKRKVRQGEQVIKLGLHIKWLPITHWTESTKDLRSGSSQHFIPISHNIVLLLRPQVILFNSRKKWGLLFALATISGMLCLPAAVDQIQNGKAAFFDNSVNLLINLALPLSTFLIITGMYILNDLFDADFDRINGKINRPIPSGRVSKRQGVVFVVLMNVIGLSVPIFANNTIGFVLASTIALIGIMYSLPKISLKDRFVIKTCAIAIAMACSLLLGASMYLDQDFGGEILGTIGWIGFQGEGQFLYQIFAGAMLALMVLVTSPLNDLGDIKGDRVAGRKTIPIVLGKKNTVWLSMFITIGIAASSWMLYAIWTSEMAYDYIHTSSSRYAIGLPLLISGTCTSVVIHLIAVLKRIEDQGYIRQSVGKKSMPLHLLLQLSLVVGCFLL